VQVYEQLNAAVEQYNSLAAPEHSESALITGSGGQVGAPANVPSAPVHASDPTAYAHADVGAPAAEEPSAVRTSSGDAQPATLAAAPAGVAASGPDLIDFGDDEGDAAPTAAPAPAPAAAPADVLEAPAGAAGMDQAVPDSTAQNDAILDDLDKVASPPEANTDTLEGAFEGMSVQKTAPATASENPFAT
jgi:hypothetical protein